MTNYIIFILSCILPIVNFYSESQAYECTIVVKISEQKLYLYDGKEIVKTYPVSTSKYGIGNTVKSNKTPLGIHSIAKKIGAGAPIGAIFDKKRRYTGKKARIYSDNTDIEEDFELTRILWLEGLTNGINKGKGIDSYYRNIYIHGTAEEGLIGTPASHGCIRMKNEDVIELFDLVSTGTSVEIKE